jgi:hypothetical protein
MGVLQCYCLTGLLEIGGFQMILSKVERVQHYDGL